MTPFVIDSCNNTSEGEKIRFSKCRCDVTRVTAVFPLDLDVWLPTGRGGQPLDCCLFSFFSFIRKVSLYFPLFCPETQSPSIQSLWLIPMR